MTAISGQGGVFEGDERRYSPTRLEGWLQIVAGPGRGQPEQMSPRRLGILKPGELARYNDRRAVWHANIGPIHTPQLVALHGELGQIVDANRQDGDKAKPAALVDAYPGLGKSTAVREFGRAQHLREVQLRGETTAEGHRRVPVVYIALTGNTQIRGLNAAICRFYGLPVSGDADTLAERAVDAVLSLRTSVFIIDDVHFLAGSRSASARMANQLKFLSNVFPVTLVYVGVGVQRSGLLQEGFTAKQALFAQFGRRTTPLTMKPFTIETDEERHQWRSLLKTIEQQLVLAQARPGMLADDLADYLYARSTGHFASLMALVNRGCQLAIRTGREHLDRELMDQVRNDAAAEDARKELAAALEAGLLTTRPARRRSARRVGATLPPEPALGESTKPAVGSKPAGEKHAGSEGAA